ncbi:autotransporter-associated beta strand repeat-containing protein, partial [Brucella endophytica]
VLTVNSGGVADLNGYSMTVGGLASGDPSTGEIKLSDNTTTGTTSTLTVNQAANSTYYGTITGPGSLVKQGAGNLTLASANAFAGGLTVEGGKVTAGADNALGSGPLTMTGGSADLNNTKQTVSGLSGAGNISLGTNTGTPQGELTVNYTGTTPETYSGELSGTGRFTKQGTGAQTLSGNNLYTGGTVVQGGALIAGSDTAFGNGALQVDAGTANLNGFDLTQTELSGAGGNIVLQNAAGTASKLTITQTVAATTPVLTDISGAGSLVMDGSGSLTLAGANTFSGGLTIDGGGTVKAGVAALNPPSPGVPSSAFGTGLLTVNAGTADLNGNDVFVAGLAGTGVGNTVNLGSATLTLKPGAGASNSYGGKVTGSGALVMDGAGTQILSGTANDFIGDITVNQGTLQAGSAKAFGDPTNILTVDGGTADLGGFDITLGGLDSSANVTTGTVALGGNTLTINQATASLDYWGAITGTGA